VITDSKGRQVVDIEIDRGYDPVDSFVTYAVYMDTGEPVPEEELDYLTETYDMHSDWIEHQAAKAEAMGEGDR
jgi:hypothetical protein